MWPPLLLDRLRPRERGSVGVLSPELVSVIGGKDCITSGSTSAAVVGVPSVPIEVARSARSAARKARAHRKLGPRPLRTPDRGRRPPIARLDDLTKGALVSGILADKTVTVVDVTWHGSEALTLTYRTADGQVAERLVYRDDEPRLAIVEEGKPWAFDGDGEAFKLASEAKRIDLAYLFDNVSLRVSITVEAEYKGTDGFADDTVRTISENAKTLRFHDFRWEK